MSLRISELPSNLERQRLGLGSPNNALHALPALPAIPAVPALPALPAIPALPASNALPDVAPLEVLIFFIQFDWFGVHDFFDYMLRPGK